GDGDGDGDTGDGDGDGDGDTGDGDGDNLACGDIELAYDSLVNSRDSADCATDSDCHVVFGHCWAGIGGCWYTLNTSVTQEALDDLADEWQAGQCVSAV